MVAATTAETSDVEDVNGGVGVDADDDAYGIVNFDAN